MSWVYKLHFTLHGGYVGATAVGLAGFALMLSAATGAYLWWPLLRGGLRTALAVRRGRPVFDVHKTVGVVGCLFLTVSAFTGVSMVFPWIIRPVAASISPATQPPHDLRSTRRPGRGPIGADAALAIARGVFPAAELGHFRPPRGADGVYVVTVRQPGEVRRTGGASGVWIDQYSGDVLAVRDWDEFTAADTFLAWQFPLHNGEAFGPAGRWTVFVSGLTPAVLYVTGFLLWSRKRRARHKRRAQRTASLIRPLTIRLERPYR